MGSRSRKTMAECRKDTSHGRQWILFKDRAFQPDSCSVADTVGIGLTRGIPVVAAIFIARRVVHAVADQLWHGVGVRVGVSSGSISWMSMSIATRAAKNVAISPGFSRIMSCVVFTNSRKVKTPLLLWLSRRLQKSSACVLVSCLSAWCASRRRACRPASRCKSAGQTCPARQKARVPLA